MNTRLDELASLAELIRQQIPLTQYLDFRLSSRVDGELVLTAPLAPNQNDKGTMFAGSLSTLATLAGWTLVGRLAADLGHRADVLAVRNEIAFVAPVRDAVEVRAVADVAMRDEFAARLARKGRARLTVNVGVLSGGVVCATFKGDYLAQVVAAH